ncbi:MAG: transglutaminase-like cysteine peptidase [Marinobacter sp.]
MPAAVSPVFRYSLMLSLLMAASLASAFQLDNRLMTWVLDQYGPAAHQRLEDWQRLHTLASNAPVDRQLEMVNRFFNRAEFVDDIDHWGEEDYWATPIELLSTDGGDCEDFAIAKYLTLKAMGLPDEQMRVVYVKALELDQAHMILAWYRTPDAEPLILDNLIDEIKPASQRTDLEPVYSFNGEGLWLNKSTGAHARIGDADELERWRDLNSRVVEPLRR